MNSSFFEKTRKAIHSFSFSKCGSEWWATMHEFLERLIEGPK